MIQASPLPAAGRMFPVLLPGKRRREFPLCPDAVPWGMVEPHAPRAAINHGNQTLDGLASRGGLDPIELLAVLDDRPYPEAAVGKGVTPVLAQAVAELIRRCGAWVRAEAARDAAGRAAPAVELTPAWCWRCPFCQTLNPAVFGMPGGAQPVAPPAAAVVQCGFCRQSWLPRVPPGLGLPIDPATVTVTVTTQPGTTP